MNKVAPLIFVVFALTTIHINPCLANDDMKPHLIKGAHINFFFQPFNQMLALIIW